MLPKEKKAILAACKEIKARKKGKLGVHCGLCLSIYQIARESVQFPVIQLLIELVAELDNMPLNAESGYIDTPYKWTRKRRRLLNKLIDVLEK